MLDSLIFALKHQLRWNYKGLLDVEDLFCLDLEDLNKIYIELCAEIRNTSVEGLIDNTDSLESKTLKVKKDIVKHIFNIKKAEQEKALKAQKAHEHHQKIMGIISAKEDQILMEKDIDELKSMLDLDE